MGERGREAAVGGVRKNGLFNGGGVTDGYSGFGYSWS